MKASTFFKAYVWAEVLFMGYLVLKPKNENQPDAIDDIKNRLKEQIENGTQEP